MPKHRERPTKRVNPSGRTVWVARYTAPDGRRRSAGTFDLQREAQEAIDRAYDQPADSSTVAAYLDRWLELRPRSPRTDRTNQGRVRAVLDVELEGRPLRSWTMRELRRRHRDELIHKMLVDQHRAAGGAKDILRSLSAMFEDAITDELADVNPWRSARVRDQDARAGRRRREPHVLTFEQMHKLARKAGAHEPMLRVLADCGLRIGELFALRRADVDGGLLHVRGTAWEGTVTGSTRQKRHDRTVPIPTGCAQLLAAMPPRIDVPWLFPTERGRVWRYSNWKRQVWVPARDRAGITATPHDFRHSWVTHLAAAGVDAADLAEMAGHSEQVAARVYTHALRRSFDQVKAVIG